MDKDSSSENELISELFNNKEYSRKSKAAYINAYKCFMTWRKDQSYNSFSENILIDYFTELKKNKKPTTLWAAYSMLKKTLFLKHQVSFESYQKLYGFMKAASVGHELKKTRKLSADDVIKFLTTAPDQDYLVEKAILIIGICGACRKLELTLLKASNVKDTGSLMLIIIEEPKARSFSVTGEFYKILKKYIAARPRNSTDRFFLTYRGYRFLQLPIGINTIAATPSKIARYLELPNPDQYTGHCFRQSSKALTGRNSDINTIINAKLDSRVSIASDDNRKMKSGSYYAPKENKLQTKISMATNVNKKVQIVGSVPEKPMNSTVLLCPKIITIQGVNTAAENIKVDITHKNNTPVNTLNLDGFKFVVVEIDRRVEVVQKGWSPPEGAEYVKPHAIFDSYKSASDYAETINVKKTPRVSQPRGPELISIDADSSNCPESSTKVKKVVNSVFLNSPPNIVTKKFNLHAPASTASGSLNSKRIIGTLVNKNKVIKTKRFIGTLVNENFTKKPTGIPGNTQNMQNFNSRNVNAGNVFIVVEKANDSPNIITGDVTQNSNPPMQIDTKDPTLTSSLPDSNILEEPEVKDNIEIKEEYVDEEFIVDDELMVVDPLAI